MVLKFVYVLFVGILLATFVGVGIAAFYPGPKQPQYPTELQYSEPLTKEATETAQMRQLRIKFDKSQTEYALATKEYNKNVCILALVGSILLMFVSLTILKNVDLVADGILLGGVLTLIYSLGRGFGTDDNKFRFVVVSTGLVISIILGYIKFNKPYAKRI